MDKKVKQILKCICSVQPAVLVLAPNRDGGPLLALAQDRCSGFPRAPGLNVALATRVCSGPAPNIEFGGQGVCLEMFHLFVHLPSRCLVFHIRFGFRGLLSSSFVNIGTQWSVKHITKQVEFGGASVGHQTNRALWRPS